MQGVDGGGGSIPGSCTGGEVGCQAGQNQNQA